MNILDKVYNLTVDIKNIDTKYNSYAKFFDDDRETSVIKIKLLNDNRPINLENCIVEAYFILADNTYHNEACKIINSSEGVVELQLCQKCLVKGENIVRLSILKDNEISNTPVITYEVRKGLYSDNPSFNDDPLTPILSQMLLDIKITKVNQIELQERYEKTLPKIEGKIEEVDNAIDRVNNAIASGTQDLEVKEARVDKNGKSYAKLGDRLNEVDSQLEQTMNNTNYVSVKSYGAIGDGVNDDTQAIQKCLNENNNVLFNDGIFLITDTLNLKSNHNILGANATIKSITDDVIGLCGKNVSNIIIDGLTFKCNDVGDGGLLNAVKIYYADNIIIRNLDVSTCKFGIFVHNITNFTIENILFNQIRTDSYSNKDGIHINGNSHYGYIKNIKGTTDDDMIALNADEVTWCFGDITNITIDGVYTINNQEYGVKDSTYQGIKLLALESKIDNINITNCYIKSDNQECFKIMGYGDVIGNFGRINITNSYFYRTSKDSQDIPVGLISNANIEKLTIQNVNFEKHTPYGNFIKTTETCDINNFVVDNVRFNNLSDTPFILMYLYGNFDKVSITNINLKQNVNSALCVNRNGFINTLFFNNISLNNAQHIFRTTTGGGVYDLIMNNIKLITGNAIVETTNSTTISKISMNNIVFKDARCLKISSEQTELVINQNNISGDDNITLSKNVDPIGKIRFKNGVVTTFYPTSQGVGDEYTYILDGVATKKFYNGREWVNLG